MNVFKKDWDYIEQLIEKALNERIRAYDDFSYMLIDENNILVKVYENKQLIFTIKFRVYGEKLEVIDAW
jgi:N-glycosylase/DNA lyase